MCNMSSRRPATPLQRAGSRLPVRIRSGREHGDHLRDRLFDVLPGDRTHRHILTGGDDSLRRALVSRAWRASGRACALTLAERLQHSVLHGGQHGIEPFQRFRPANRDGDDVPTPVVGIGLTAHQPVGDEIVDGGHDVTSIDPRPSAEVRLARGSELLERREQSEVVAADALTGKGVVQDLLGTQVGAAEQPGRLCADTSQRGHLTEPRHLLGTPTICSLQTLTVRHQVC